jgi:hypothetical protein
MVSLKLEIYIFTVAKTTLKLTGSTRKALRMRIDVAVLVENTRDESSVAHGKEISVQGGFFCLGRPQKKLLAGHPYTGVYV